MKGEEWSGGIEIADDKPTSLTLITFMGAAILKNTSVT